MSESKHTPQLFLVPPEKLCPPLYVDGAKRTLLFTYCRLLSPTRGGLSFRRKWSLRRSRYRIATRPSIGWKETSLDKYSPVIWWRESSCFLFIIYAVCMCASTLHTSTSNRYKRAFFINSYCNNKSPRSSHWKYNGGQTKAFRWCDFSIYCTVTYTGPDGSLMYPSIYCNLCRRCLDPRSTICRLWAQ